MTLNEPELEERKPDAEGVIRVDLVAEGGENHPGLVASRQSAKALRERIESVMRKHKDAVIEIDFGNLEITSSSLADELVAKSLAKLGPVRFGERFRMINISPNVAGLINLACEKRLAASAASTEGGEQRDTGTRQGL